MVNQEAVDKLVTEVLCDQYVKSPQYTIDRAALMTIAISSDQQIDDYLQAAIASGVSIESASVCISLFLKLKISENVS